MSVFRDEREFECECKKEKQSIKIIVTGEPWKKIFAWEVGNAFLKWVRGYFVGWF